MTNLSVGGDFRIAAATSEPTLTSAPGVTSSAQKSVGALYPQLSTNIAASSLAQLKNTPVILIEQRGDDAMQQVQPKGTGSTPGPSSGCNDGVLAKGSSAVWTGVGAVAEATKEAPEHTSTALGEAGKYAGAGTCEAIEAVGDAVAFAGSAVAALFSPDQQNVPTEDGHGETCTDPGPTGGESRGTTGGYSANPNGGSDSSPGASYIDPTTGEPITNKGGTTTAGDPNADTGTYIGEVDDPNFTGNQSSLLPVPARRILRTSTTADNTTTESTVPDEPPAEEAHGTDDPGPKPDAMPADDGSGSTGPAGPRSYIYSSGAEVSMPADDSAGGGTPRSNVASVAHVAVSPTLFNVALSRSQLT